MQSWIIKSKTDPRISYTVSMITEYQWECTCPHFRNRHVACKHIEIIRRKYDQQTHKNQPAPNASGEATISSDSGRPPDEGSPVPGGELRGSSSDDGKPAGTPEGTQPDGSGGHSGDSQNPKDSVGTPAPEPDVPGPVEGSNPTPPAPNPEVRPPTTTELLLAKRAEQVKKLTDWEMRVSPASAAMHRKLKPLVDEYKVCENLARRKTLELQIKPLTVCIRWLNQKDCKVPPFDIGLVDANLEEMEESEKVAVLALF